MASLKHIGIQEDIDRLSELYIGWWASGAGRIAAVDAAIRIASDYLPRSKDAAVSDPDYRINPVSRYCVRGASDLSRRRAML